eukprot:COSAG05_NODE_799_length_7238_cov_4.050707_11_plen_331_part_00
MALLGARGFMRRSGNMGTKRIALDMVRVAQEAAKEVASVAPPGAGLTAWLKAASMRLIQPLLKNDYLWPISKKSAPAQALLWAFLIGVMYRLVKMSRSTKIAVVEARRREYALSSLENIIANEDERLKQEAKKEAEEAKKKLAEAEAVSMVRFYGRVIKAEIVPGKEPKLAAYYVDPSEKEARVVAASMVRYYVPEDSKEPVLCRYYRAKEGAEATAEAKSKEEEAQKKKKEEEEEKDKLAKEKEAAEAAAGAGVKPKKKKSKKQREQEKRQKYACQSDLLLLLLPSCVGLPASASAGAGCHHAFVSLVMDLFRVRRVQGTERKGGKGEK